MKQATYTNRYGDEIKFTELSETEVEMSGYNSEWLRVGWANDYSEAYEVYLNSVNYYTSYEEFIHKVENNEEYRPYLKYVKSDKSTYNMVDPSGGPYIALGMDVGRYFNDGVKRIIKTIQFNKDNKITFTIK